MRLVSPVSFALLVGSLSACADKGDEGMFIFNNTAVPSGGTCSTTGDQSQLSLALGAISYYATDSHFNAGYILAPLIESRITALTGNEAQRTIHLEGADVTVQSVTDGGAGQSRTVLFSGAVAPNGGTTNVVFEVLPAQLIKQFGSATENKQVLATVVVYGTLGGGRIDAEPFEYPITIVAQGNGIVGGLGSQMDDSQRWHLVWSAAPDGPNEQSVQRAARWRDQLLPLECRRHGPSGLSGDDGRLDSLIPC